MLFKAIFEEINLPADQYLVHTGKGIDSYGYEWYRFPDDFRRYSFEEVILNTEGILDELILFLENMNIYDDLVLQYGQDLRELSNIEFNRLLDDIFQETSWIGSDVIIVSQNQIDEFE